MIAKVYVNCIQVGSIPIEQYKEIKKSAYKDKLNYILQLLNTIKFLVKLIVKAIKLIPFVWLLITFYCILFDLQQLTIFITVFQENSPERIAEFIKSMFLLGLGFGFIFVLFEAVLFRNNFEYENSFKSAIELAILDLLEIPQGRNVFIQVEK